MRCLLAVVTAVAAFAPLSALGAAEPAAHPAKPLRSIVFDVAYSAHSKHEKRTSGFNSGGANGMSPEAAGVGSGNGTAGFSLDGSDTGRLTVDVIAATADGGLVVDAEYAGKLSAQPKLRIALLPDGRLSADPTKAIDATVLHVLPLLARSFIANRDVSPGAAWTIVAPSPAKGATTYRVTSLDGENATLSLEGYLSVPGIAGFDQTDRGVTKYATELIVPLSYDVTSRIRRQVGIDETVTTDAHFTVTLLSDTFAKKK